MNKKTVILLSTTMMSIATAACAFCVSQTANAAEASTPTISGVSTAKVTTPPPQLKILLLKKPILLRQMA